MLKQTLMFPLLGGALLMGLAFSGTAAAAAQFCAASSTLDVTDVTWEGTNSNDCYGIVTSTNVADTTLQAALNAEPLLSAWGGGWSFVVKDDNESLSNTGSFAGVNFTLDADVGSVEGNWTLSWSGALPKTFDMVVTLKGGGGTNWVAYLFNAVDFPVNPASGTGTFLIKIPVGIGNPSELSGLSLFMRDSVSVPEPSTLALLGLGMLALGMVRRRKLNVTG